MTNPCLIVECSEADTWPNLYTGEPPRSSTNPGPLRIPENRKPTMLQPDRETAEEEARRLAAAKGGDRVFVVFEAAAAVRMVTIPTHTTLGGKTTGERRVAQVLDLGEDDGIPF